MQKKVREPTTPDTINADNGDDGDDNNNNWGHADDSIMKLIVSS